MTIAVDQNLGSTGADTAGTTVALTTSAAAASGSFIVLSVTWFGAGSLSSVSGGGLTWTIDKQDNTGSLQGTAIVSAQAPSGLASSTTITATYAASVSGGRFIAGESFTGVVTSSPVDGTPPAVHQDGATGAWTTNTATVLATSMLFALAFESTNLFTSTTTGPAVELHDFGGGGVGATDAYVLPGSAGSFAIAGTWSSAPGGNLSNAIAVAYKAAATVAAASGRFPVFLPRSLGPRAVGPTFFAALQPLFVPATGPAILAASTADTSLTTSSCVRVLALPRPVADTSASSDAVTRTEALPRSTADTSVSSDAATRVLTLPRATADTSTTSDAVTRVLRLPRSTADTSASSDSVTRVLALPRATADTSASSDTATRVLALPRSTADTSLSSDVATGSTAAHFARSTADTSLSSDAVTTVTRFPRSTADTTTTTESLSRFTALPRATSDTSLSSDSTSRLLHLFRVTADTSLTSDSASTGPHPTPPPITPPTTATLTPYRGAGAIVAYHSTASIPEPAADADLGNHMALAAVRSYTGAAAIVAYTTRATIRPYTSSARLGPTYG